MENLVHLHLDVLLAGLQDAAQLLGRGHRVTPPTAPWHRQTTAVRLLRELLAEDMRRHMRGDIYSPSTIQLTTDEEQRPSGGSCCGFSIEEDSAELW